MDIAHNLEMNTSAETAYNAVSTNEGIKGWWCMDNDVSQKVGDQFTLRFNKQGTIVPMDFKVASLEPHKKVVWECIANANATWIGTRLVTEIMETEKGCSVKFTHAGFDDGLKGNEAFEMTREGWNHFMKSLASLCEEGVGQPW